MAFKANRPSFTTGEISPLIDARVDVQRYSSACKTLENMTVLPYGGVRRRPGTVYVNEVSDSSKAARVFDFRFSTTTNYVILLQEGSMSFFAGSDIDEGGAFSSDEFSDAFYTGGISLTGDAPPWTSSQLFRIQTAQINDLIYFVHPEHPPYKLTRTSATTFVLEEVEWDWPPMLDLNVTSTTIRVKSSSPPSAWVTATGYSAGDEVTANSTEWVALEDIPSSGTTFEDDLKEGLWGQKIHKEGDTVTLVASSGIFNSDMVGGYFELDHDRGTSSVEIENLHASATSYTSDTITVLGEWTVYTSGNWNGTLTVERSEDDGATWEVIRTFTSRADRNVEAVGTQDDVALFRLNYERNATPASTFDPRAWIEVSDQSLSGFVKITGFTSTTEVTATVGSDLGGNAPTKDWSQGAWSDDQGFPGSITLHEQRLTFGGSVAKAQTIWMSKTDDFETFRSGVNDDDAVIFTIGATEANGIVWLLSQTDLLIGTLGGEFIAGPLSNGDPISPSSIRVARQTAFGSWPVQAVLANESALYVGNSGRSIREMVYSFQKDGYQAPDLSILSEHIGFEGFREIAVMRGRFTRLLAVTNDGTIACMTYDKSQEVIGWSRWTTDGEFESVATIYGDYEDEIWVIVKRTINGSTVRYIEKFFNSNEVLEASGDRDDLVYVDCAKEVTGTNMVAVSGLDHLDGELVDIVADGCTHPQKTVASGIVEFDFAVQKAQIGLAYESKVQPTSIETNFKDGTTDYRSKRVSRVNIRFYKSSGAVVYQESNGNIDRVIFRLATDTGDGTPPDLFTGFKEVAINANYSKDGSIYVVQQDPQPMTILSIGPEQGVYG